MSRKLTGPVVIATHNPGKLTEMRDLLSPFGIIAQSAGELGLSEPEETGRHFRRECAHQGNGRDQSHRKAGFR